MTEFRVKFLKVVCDSTGHERQICQREIRVAARSRAAALARAEVLFCRLEQISVWSLRADKADLEQLGPDDRRVA